MKAYNRSLSIVFTILLFAPSSQAQFDSVSGFYPLQIGNSWQYKETYFYRLFGSIAKTEKYYCILRVTNDTVLSNGITYKAIQVKVQKPGYVSPSYFFQRLDTLTKQVFGFSASKGDYLVDSLRAPVGSGFHGSPTTSILGTMVVSIDSQYYLGVRSICRTSEGGMPEFAFFHQTINYGLGLTTRTMGYPGDDMYPGDSYVDTLVYASINGKEYGTLVSVTEDNELPLRFSLSQNYPNPFNPSTTIAFDLPTPLLVTLAIYDYIGREVTVLVNGLQHAGHHEVQFHASQLSSGVYFYRIRAGNFLNIKKMILIK